MGFASKWSILKLCKKMGIEIFDKWLISLDHVTYVSSHIKIICTCWILRHTNISSLYLCPLSRKHNTVNNKAFWISMNGVSKPSKLVRHVFWKVRHLLAFLHSFLGYQPYQIRRKRVYFGIQTFCTFAYTFKYSRFKVYFNLACSCTYLLFESYWYSLLDDESWKWNPRKNNPF